MITAFGSGARAHGGTKVGGLARGAYVQRIENRYFLWFLKGNEGFGKVKKLVFNFIKGILVKWKGKNMKLWGFHGK